MMIKTRKLVLDLIIFMAYYFNGFLDLFPAHLCHVVNYCSLPVIPLSIKRYFHCIFPSKWGALPQVSPLRKHSFDGGKRSPLKRCSSRALPPTRLHWEASQHPSTTLSPISNRQAGVLQIQQLLQKQKMKRTQKVLVSSERGDASELPSLSCPFFVSIFYFIFPASLSLRSSACSRQTYINALAM